MLYMDLCLYLHLMWKWSCSKPKPFLTPKSVKITKNYLSSILRLKLKVNMWVKPPWSNLERVCQKSRLVERHCFLFCASCGRDVSDSSGGSRRWWQLFSGSPSSSFPPSSSFLLLSCCASPRSAELRWCCWERKTCGMSISKSHAVSV